MSTFSNDIEVYDFELIICLVIAFLLVTVSRRSYLFGRGTPQKKMKRKETVYNNSGYFAVYISARGKNQSFNN